MPDTSPQLILTDDGSHSLFFPGLNETYHSRNGAMQESQHVFIANGLSRLSEMDEIAILEVGFGTGLNALLSLIYCEKSKQKIRFTTLETFPIPVSIYQELNYAKLDFNTQFLKLHEAEWGSEIQIDGQFLLCKMNKPLQEFEASEKFDLVFYDAFGPPAQPEMWSKEILNKVVTMMKSGGVFVTYCAKGQVRRDLEACGLLMERLPGPPGKREMLRGTKL
jgi:tRNA U34 5-methylaminomethyl-2-thiouridine-forming methyltransferase MnmC